MILTPDDFDHASINNAATRRFMSLIEFAHGGKEYDDKYPEGIPTRIEIELSNGKSLDSHLVMFPSGHSKNKTADL